MHSAAGCIAKENRFGAHRYQPVDVVFARAEGVYLTDLEGRRYMDFMATYAGAGLGHNHPKVARAVIDAIRAQDLTSRAFRNDRLPALLERLSRVTGFEKALVLENRAEAAGIAVQAMRKWAWATRRVSFAESEVIVADGTTRAPSRTVLDDRSDPDGRSAYGPFTPGVRIVPFGDLEAVAAAINPRTAGIFMEPVQGEAGVRIPPRGFLRGLRELAFRRGVLLVLDETQSGLGRTGRVFAFEHEGIRPDAVLLGKDLTGGFFPSSVLLADAEVMDTLGPGIQGSALGASPLACAAACAVLDAMVEEDLPDRAARLAEPFQKRLEGLRRGQVKDLRSLGLWAGIDLQPWAGTAWDGCLALQERGLLCRDARVRTIRLAPPLVITPEELGWAMDQLEAVLA
jgi:ornithine--oxo-acid transaminase